MFLKFKLTDMSFAKKGQVIYQNYDNSIVRDLSDEEMQIVKSLFHHHIIHNAKIDMPSCGFVEERSIRFNDSHTFCIACDGCDVIYWKEKNVYFCISDKKMNILKHMFIKYGIRFDEPYV